MSGKEIGTLEAKTRLSQLLAEVQRGESFFITRHGKRIAERTSSASHGIIATHSIDCLWRKRSSNN